MSARIYPDDSILLTLDYEQEPLLRKCIIFQTSVQKAKINCYMLSTVRMIRERITSQVIEAGGNSLRGLWHHLCMNKGAGLPHILTNAMLGDEDIPGIQTYFRQKIREQERELSKSQIQAVELWAIEVFRDMPRDQTGHFPVMDYLQKLSVYLNEYYVQSKNALLRTEKELGIIDETPVNPTPDQITMLVDKLHQCGSSFDDREDLCHIAALSWLKQNKGYIPIFVTADRKLYEQKDELYNITGVIVEDPLYAVGTYRSITQKP
ncbi:MAG: hypothetical protein QXZ70_05735 [Candidatus Bathyarchaeia archaeon]